MEFNYDPYAITDADLARMICDDSFYPANETFGVPQWLFSTNILSYEHCLALFFDEKLAKSAAQIKTPAFSIERCFDGERLKKMNAVGDLFYHALAKPRLPACPEFYEPSVRREVLYSVAKAHNLSAIHFTGNPLAYVNAHGLLEGEAANSYLIRVGETLNRESARERIKGRMAQINSQLLKVSRYVDRCAKTLVYPLVQEFRFFNFASSNPPSPEQSLAHMTSFLADLRAAPTIAPEGTFWKRQHTTEAGANFRFLAIYDAQKFRFGKVPTSEVCSLWTAKTEGRGLAVATVNFVDQLALKKHLRLMFLRDLTLQLKSSKELPTFATGVLPPPAKSKEKFTATTNFNGVSFGEQTQARVRLDVAGPSVRADFL